MATTDNQQIQDPSTQGVGGLKGLEGIKRLKEKGIDIDTSILYLANDYRGSMQAINEATTPKQNIGFVGVGDSIWDKDITSASQLDNLANTRGELQPWYAQIAAGLTKGVILAGTTFLNSTIGLVVGGWKAFDEDRVSALWDNPYSEAMKGINDWAEYALPNYYTDAEINDPWYEHIFSANFIGDKFIKNLGFTVGAISAARATFGLGAAMRLPELIGLITQSARVPAIVASVTGSILAAMNEGRIEALNGVTEWFESEKTILYNQHIANLKAIDDQYSGTEMHDALVENENSAYEATLGKLSEDRLKMGNMDLLMNTILLTGPNILQFGKLLSRGYNTGRRASNIVKKAGGYGTTMSTKKGVARAALNPLSEGLEEISQKAANIISGNYYEDDVNNFYKAKIDPQAEQETLSWMKSFAQGINETVNDGSSWEEFFIGSLTGALGAPFFRGIRNSEGKLQSPIYLEGGIRREFKNYRERMNRETMIANRMNERINSPEFLNYYQGLIRHNKYQKDMNQAIENGDEFEFKNAEHAQLISDIMLFSNAGKLEDLTDLINSACDTSDENLAAIVEHTSSTIVGEDGKKHTIGPFINENGEAMYSTPDGKQEMISKLTESKDEILKAIKSYNKIKNSIDIQSKGLLSDEQLEELTWLKSQIGNWKDRTNSLSSEVKPSITKLYQQLSQQAAIQDEIKTEKGMAHAGLSDLYKTANKNSQQLKKTMSILETINSLNDETFARLLASDSDLVKELKSLITDPINNIAADEAQTLNQKIDDIVKLVNATGKYNTKLKEYLENPTKLQEDIASSTEKVAKEETKRKSGNLKSKLSSATNLSEFRQALNDEEDTTIKEEALNSLENEKNELAKNYKETQQYNNEVRKALNELEDVEPQAKEDALKLLQDQYENSSNLNEITNPNSVYINNDTAFDEDSEGDVELSKKRFQKAQYALQSAMYQVNNDNGFKDRFSKEYKKPVEKREGTVRGDDKATTGDSGTSTIPTVNNTNPSMPVYEPPAGNITSTQVKDENEEINSRTVTPQSFDNGQKGKKPYYRPAIPELHIQASKEGDFRPFDVVVKERERGVDFSEIYNYLRENGAFEYVNQGNLKVGSELGFMIDPEYEKRVEGQSWHTQPTIFIIDKKNGQVVGSLDEGGSVNNFEGLAGLEEKVRKEYAEWKNSTGTTPNIKEKLNENEPFTIKERIIIDSSLGEGMTQVFGYDPDISTDENNRALVFWKNRVNDPRALRNPKTGNTRENFYIELKNGTSVITFFSNKNQKQFGRADGLGITIWRKLTPQEESEIQNYLYNKEKIPSYVEIARYVDSVLHKQQITQQDTTKSKFIATPTTKVSKIMVGKVPYNTEEKSLANIPNVSREGKSPIFGIIKNGVLSTNGKLDDSAIIKPIDMAQKEGRIYLLIPNAAGKYSPVAVRIKHFNKNEFNPENIEIQETQVYKNIQESINALANSLSEDDLNKAVNSLAMNLYTGDLHIDLFTSKAGNGIRFTKVQRDSQGNEIYEEKEGKRLRKETVKTVFLTEKWDPNTLFSITGTDEVQSEPASKNIEDISKEISEILLEFNLPIQVNLGMLNKGGYNNMLIGSGVLTSNITDARVIDSWFTTDYFDTEGNLHKATNPSFAAPQPKRKIETPVNGTERAISGTKIVSVFSGKSYYVDLSTNTIKNEQGQVVPITNKNKVLLALAWAQDSFGEATNGSSMWNNKVLLPNRQILDRKTQKYLEGKEAQEVRDKINGRAKVVENSNEIISKIAENQKKVDKTRTDGEAYYILEEDGKYHKYERVHSRLGSNFTKSKDTINSQRALNAGTAVDNVIRNFFTSNDTPIKPDNMSEGAFADLIDSLIEIRSAIEKRGERFLTNNIVLFHKYADGTRVAGEVDILSVDNKGNFRIYDVKTSRYSFYDAIDRQGNKVNYFTNPSSTQKISTKDYYTLQLSAYKNLFESQYNTSVVTLAILPFVLSYDKDTVNKVTKEKGIIITYNPDVNVPLGNTVKINNTTSTNLPLPIFNSTLEIQDPINDILPEYGLEGGKIGYFVRDGEIHKSYLTSIGEVNGIDIHMAKVPNMTKGFGRQGEGAHVASNSYMAIFPNGNSIMLINNDPMTMTEQQAKDTIKKILNGNPQRVIDMANESTLISNSLSSSISNSIESGAAKTMRKEQKLEENSDEEREDDLRLRKAEENTTSWNQEKELAWIDKVLPQLSKENRVKVVQGIIRVANRGTLAWGQFDKGIITLSNIAAEGTTYHESFHAVFNLLLDNNERQSLYDEAKKLYGEKDNLSLEEDMAEGFREYVMTRQSDNLLDKIKNFFKDLWIKVVNWRRIRPHLTAYYQMINSGKYSNKEIPVESLNQTRMEQEGYTQEMKDIIANAKKDGEGNLLAPNGKKSNLTEKQYAQVRTKAFKEWFGDWEKAANANRVSLGKEIPNTDVYSKYGQKGETDIEIREVLDENNNVIGTVRMEFSGKGRKGVVTLHPDLIVTGRGYGTALYQHVANTYNINVEESFGEIGKSKAAKRMWDKIYNTVSKDSETPLRQLTPSNTSKVIDENGEPLVVYHGGSSTNIFDTRGGYYGAGIRKGDIGTYFTPSMPLAQTYEEMYTYKFGGEIDYYMDLKEEGKISDEEYKKWEESLEIKGGSTRAFFLNIKNPKITTYEKIKGEEFERKDSNVGNNDGQYIRIQFHTGNNYKEEEYVVYNSNQIKSATDNVGTFSKENDDIRYRKVTKEQLLDNIKKEINKAKKSVQELNKNRYNTPEEAKAAFYNSGINRDFYRGITRRDPNGAIGHKIMLLTDDEFNNLLADEETKYDLYMEDQNAIKAKKKGIWLFDSLDSDTQTDLMNAGWTKEKFDSISQEEREYAIACATL